MRQLDSRDWKEHAVEPIRFYAGTIYVSNRADDKFTLFFEGSLTFPISVHGSTDVIIRYATGQLSPSLQQSSNVSLGFSVSFWHQYGFLEKYE
jgi:hypothetical protein